MCKLVRDLSGINIEDPQLARLEAAGKGRLERVRSDAQRLIQCRSELVDLLEIDYIPKPNGLVLAYRDDVHLEFVEVDGQDLVRVRSEQRLVVVV